MKKGRPMQEEQNKRVRLLAGFMFNFRYATLRQIHTFIQLIMDLSYTRRLVAYSLKSGYLKSYFEPTLSTKIYYLTQKGKNILYGEEALVEYYHFAKSLAGLNTFVHHNMLVQVYFLLKSHLDIKEWVCEWVLRMGKKRREKIPDALMILPDDTKIALEVESRYKRLVVLKSLVTMYRYDIEKIARYNAVLIVADSRIHYEGLKKRLYNFAPEFCSKRLILSDVVMLEHGMCFYQGNSMHLEEAFSLLKKG
jgi:hypothetical protein